MGSPLGCVAIVAVKAIATGSYPTTPPARAVDGDPTTAWCQRDLGDTLTIGFAPMKDVAVEIYRDDDTPLRVTAAGVTGSEIVADPGPARLAFHEGKQKKIGWITIAPFADTPACVREVEITDPTPPPSETKAKAERLDHKPSPPPSPRPAAPVRAQIQDPLTGDALAAAPDAIRALRLAIDDCDASWLALWVVYPLPIGTGRLTDARRHAAACARGDELATAPSVADVERQIAHLAPDASGTLVLRFGALTWRLAWRKRQWWLVVIEGEPHEVDTPPRID